MALEGRCYRQALVNDSSPIEHYSAYLRDGTPYVATEEFPHVYRHILLKHIPELIKRK